MLVTCQSLRILTTDLWGSLWISDWLPSACEPLSRHASVCCLCSCVWVSVVCVCFYLVRHLWVLLVGPNCWGHRIDLFVQGFINDRSVFQSNCTIIVAHPGKCVLTPMFIYGFLLLLIQWFAVVLFSQNQELELKYDHWSIWNLRIHQCVPWNLHVHVHHVIPFAPRHSQWSSVHLSTDSAARASQSDPSSR